MAVIGEIAVQFVAHANKYFKTTKKVRKDTTKTAKAFKALRLAALAASAAFANEMRKSLSRLDEVAKVSRKLGIASEEFMALAHAARISGISQNTFAMAMQRMTRRVAEAAKGMGEAQGALKALRIDAEALAAMTPDQQFRKLAEAFQDVEGSSEQLRLAFKLFDSEGTAMLEMLRLSTEQLTELEHAAKRLGMTFSEGELAAIETFNDTLTTMQGAIEGLAGRSMVMMIDGVTRLKEGLGGVLDDLKQIVDLVPQAFRSGLGRMMTSGALPGLFGSFADGAPSPSDLRDQEAKLKRMRDQGQQLRNRKQSEVVARGILGAFKKGVGFFSDVQKRGEYFRQQAAAYVAADEATTRKREEAKQFSNVFNDILTGPEARRFQIQQQRKDPTLEVEKQQLNVLGDIEANTAGFLNGLADLFQPANLGG